jgi:putative ABC transport system ATP-binding protein
MMPDLLALHEVSKSYRRGARHLRVLVDVSLRLGSRETVAVLGSRYDGKTTLLKIAGGLERPDEGEVLFEGQALNRILEEKRSHLLGDRIAWVNGSPPALALRTLDYLALPSLMGRGRSRREAEELAMSALERVGIPGCAHAWWGDLSNWERVLVALAQGIANSPKLLILDDLLDGLGMRRTREISELLAALVEELPCGILMSVSDPEGALGADRIFVFERGRLEAMTNGGPGEAEIIGFPHGRQSRAAKGAGS